VTRRLVVLAVVSVIVVALAPFAGGGLDGPRGEFIVWQLRVPRVLVAALVGGMLSLAGAVFQAIFANPLATPSTVGTIAGATLGALAALVLPVTSVLGGMPATVVGAFVGALVVSLVVAGFASSGRAGMADVLLAGIGVTLATSAIATGLQYTADMRAMFAAAQWSLGHLPQVGYRGVLVLTPAIVASAAVLLAQRRALQALAVDEDLARAQGVDVGRTRTVALVASSAGVAACVAWCGPIAFVGLMVPHIVRRIVGVTQRMVLPASFIGGAAFLVACDTVARLALPGRELPVGVITAMLGAPTLVFLVARRRR
jgi:ABC-type Fe3+-siderophore transport system permease subunit